MNLKPLLALTMQGQEIKNLEFVSNEEKMVFSLLVRNDNDIDIPVKYDIPFGTKIISAAPNVIPKNSEFVLEVEQELNVHTQGVLKIIPVLKEIYYG